MTVITAEVDVEELVVEHVRLAQKIAFDYLSRAPRHTDTDEVVSASLLGLVEAAQRFDPDRGIPFPSWASSRIYGAIVDAAREVDPLSRRTRAGIRRLRDAEDTLTAELGHIPAESALAQRAGLPAETVRKLKTDLYRGVVVSLDETLPSQDDTFAATLVDADPTPLESLEKRELDAYLRDAVALLPERLRAVVEGYFIRGETNAEIAQRLGVTPQRVSQLRSEALRMLRTGVEAQYADVPATDHALGAPLARPLAAQVSYAAAIAAHSTYAQRLTSSL